VLSCVRRILFFLFPGPEVLQVSGDVFPHSPFFPSWALVRATRILKPLSVGVVFNTPDPSFAFFGWPRFFSFEVFGKP